MMDQLERQRLARILDQTKNIALVGASNKPNRASYDVMQYLLAHGFNVLPVNPQLAGTVILGQICVGSLAELKQPIDLVDVFRRSEFAAQIAVEAIAENVSCLWLQEDVTSVEAAKAASEAGMDYIEDLCIKKVHTLLMKSK